MNPLLLSFSVKGAGLQRLRVVQERRAAAVYFHTKAPSEVWCQYKPVEAKVVEQKYISKEKGKHVTYTPCSKNVGGIPRLTRIFSAFGCLSVSRTYVVGSILVGRAPALRSTHLHGPARKSEKYRDKKGNRVKGEEKKQRSPGD